MSNLTINLLPEGLREPPVYFCTASAHYPQKTTRYPEGALQFHQILMVVSGTGELHCGGETHPLSRGCAFFTAMGQETEYVNTGGLVTAFLTARGEAMEGMLEHYGCGSFLFAPRTDLEKSLEAIRQIIREYYERKREGLLSAMTYRFFVDFLEEQLRFPMSALDQTGLYIEKHFREKLTLEGLAAVTGVSVSKLCHDFKTRFGCSVFSYILDLRLTYGRRLLLSTREARIQEAAHACGFEDVSYFCKAYKKKFGKTPAQDRDG